MEGFFLFEGVFCLWMFEILGLFVLWIIIFILDNIYFILVRFSNSLYQNF